MRTLAQNAPRAFCERLLSRLHSTVVAGFRSSVRKCACMGECGVQLRAGGVHSKPAPQPEGVEQRPVQYDTSIAQRGSQRSAQCTEWISARAPSSQAVKVRRQVPVVEVHGGLNNAVKEP